MLSTPKRQCYYYIKRVLCLFILYIELFQVNLLSQYHVKIKNLFLCDECLKIQLLFTAASLNLDDNMAMNFQAMLQSASDDGGATAAVTQQNTVPSLPLDLQERRQPQLNSAPHQNSTASALPQELIEIRQHLNYLRNELKEQVKYIAITYVLYF